MDTAESSLHAKGKGSKKAAGSNPRAKPINWPLGISEFLLDWYIEKKLTMPPKISFKKLHHTECTKAVNAKYGTTYSVDQVHRHWRRHRDSWGLVAKYLNYESGAGWDAEQKLFQLSESTLENLSANDRGILTKSIQFYDKLQELFSGSTADGSIMKDPSTAAEDEDDEADNQNMMNYMSNYDQTDAPQGEDSDKLESDSDECQVVAALAATASQVSSSNVQSMKPNKKSFKRAGKAYTLPAATKNDRANKCKSKHASQDDDVDVKTTNSLEKIEQALVKPVQVAPPPDPNTPLWDMLKQIALTTDDRLAVGAHVCKPEFQVLRGFLVNMGQDYLERWVYKFLSGGDPDS
ncbi:unnamed protein product [Urochloa humidicola]